MTRRTASQRPCSRHGSASTAMARVSGYPGSIVFAAAIGAACGSSPTSPEPAGSSGSMTQQISGLVTSQSPEGIWPLAGAVVEVLAEGRPTPVAHTRTDAAGRYVLTIAIEPYTYLAI